MSKLHFMAPTSPTEDVTTVRLGVTGTANRYADTDVGKPVKLTAESAYSLTAAGDEIEGFITSVETAPSGGFSIGGIIEEGMFNVTLDGLQATPGTGVVALGDYVVAGTAVARNTAMTVYPKVCKATGAPNTLNYKWRVVSLGTAGTGAVGTSAVIKCVM